uniref:UDP-glucuronosyltransferase n=1 Tax=Helicoverpa armigera TaxID=29058 RepID=G9LPN3_HELAM|nr:UDP-glycosyltransferase UGT33B2 [Helicoverpa armigera]
MLLVSVILLLSITGNDAARILAMFPVPSISHQVVFRPLTQELAKRGHEVTVITPDPAFPKGGGPPTLKEIDVHFTYDVWSKMFAVTSTGEQDMIKQMEVAFNLIANIVEIQLKVDEVQRILKEEKFDLLLVEACARPTLVLSHVFKVPVIQVSSYGPLNFNIDTMGMAWHPLLYPLNLNQRLYNLTMMEKLKEVWNVYRLHNLMNEVEVAENDMAKRLFGPNIATIQELKNNVHMLLMNIHPLWEDNRPVPPSVIYMGGVHQKPEKELPADLKTYLDSSKNGVIYVSFGTNVKPSMLPPEKVRILVKVFSELPYDVLWKWDKDELPGRTSNIKIFKWLPQSDLLRHPKVKVFITQGGLQSTDEAITAGVPLIGFPMLGDQWFNVEKYEYHKIGLRLNMNTLTEEQFKSSVEKVVGDISYRKNTERLRSLMHDQPMKSLDNAVWWTEHVLRHGGARHLRSPAANMSWAEYLELELVFTVLSIALSILLLASFILYELCKYVVGRPLEKKIKAN